VEVVQSVEDLITVPQSQADAIGFKDVREVATPHGVLAGPKRGVSGKLIGSFLG